MPFAYDPSDPPTPLAVARRLLGGSLLLATGGLIVRAFAGRQVTAPVLGLVSVLWVFWGVFHDVFAVVLDPLATWLGQQLAGGADSGPPVHIDIEQETRMLETLLAQPIPVVHRELLAGIRLAEIYRTHQHDQAKSDALLARLRSKYPDARELILANGLPT